MDKREIVTELNGNTVALVLHNEFYEKEAIRAASYKFTGKCTILIRPADDWEIEVVFEAIPGLNFDLGTVAREFCNEVLDQQVRLDLEKRYGRVRELIVRQAFAPIKDLKVELTGDE
jgi:His-Xaa-Ser system protein HxsD